MAPFAHSTGLLEALREVGVGADLFTADGAGHGFFDSPPWYQSTLERMAEFFVETLGKGGRWPWGRSWYIEMKTEPRHQSLLPHTVHTHLLLGADVNRGTTHGHE